MNPTLNLRLVVADLLKATLALCALFAGLPSTAQSQDNYPSRAITLIVPFPAGSGSDMSARLLAKDMAEFFKQTVLVDNKPGANGAIGSQVVARAKPDGYTLLVGVATTNATNYALYPGRLGYQPASFDIVSGLGAVPLSLYVNAAAPWKNLAEFLADARKNPGKLACGSGTTVAQVACEVFMKRAGVNLLNVPYKGTPPALTDLAGGQVQLVFADGTSASVLMEQKRVRVLGTATGSRLPYWPEVPTFVELGMTDLEMYAWSALFAPAGTPVAVLQKLNAATRRSIDSAESVASRKRTGSLALAFSLEEGRRFIDGEIARWAKLVKDSGVKPD